MSTVIVSFRFLAPHRPAGELVAAHRKFLCKLRGLQDCIALERDFEHAFILTFEDATALDRYLASDAYRQYSTQPGCYDVFVNQFDSLSIPVDADTVANLQYDAPQQAAIASSPAYEVSGEIQ